MLFNGCHRGQKTEYVFLLFSNYVFMKNKSTKLSHQLTLLLILSPKKEAHVTKTNKQTNNKWADVAWRLVRCARYQKVGVSMPSSEWAVRPAGGGGRTPLSTFGNKECWCALEARHLAPKWLNVVHQMEACSCTGHVLHMWLPACNRTKTLLSISKRMKK